MESNGVWILEILNLQNKTGKFKIYVSGTEVFNATQIENFLDA